VCGVLRPRFVTERQYRTLQGAAEAVGQAIQQIGAATLRNPALLEPYALSDNERTLLALEPGYAGAAVFGRLDGFLDDNGGWCWFVESNLESPAGIAYEEMLLEIFGELPVMQEFARRHQVRSFPLRQQLHELLLKTYRGWGGAGTPSLAIVDYRNGVTWPEFEHLQARFSAAGTPTMLVRRLGYGRAVSWAVALIYAFATRPGYIPAPSSPSR